MRQKVGNFPGVTVDKKTGFCKISEKLPANIIDLPGTYSLYPRRADEMVAYKVLLRQDDTVSPDMILLVADASNLRRSLLFCTQIIDLNYPVVIALTMLDIAKQKGIKIDLAGLERELGVPIVELIS
jgi:ferrous iron transport protein B